MITASMKCAGEECKLSRSLVVPSRLVWICTSLATELSIPPSSSCSDVSVSVFAIGDASG